MISGSGFGFAIKYDTDLSSQNASAPSGEQRVFVEEFGMHPGLRWLDHKEWRIGILGNPIAGSRRDDSTVLDAFINSGNIKEFARKLNGSFLILLYQCETKCLYIVNDRFASLALFYSMDATTFHASMFLSDLISMRRKAGLSISFDSGAIFEFVSMRRLFGEHTYETHCLFLASASILTLTPGDRVAHVEKYWTADFTRQAPCGYELIDAIAEALEKTVNLHMSDQGSRRYALFLSGGLDARAVLAASVGNSHVPLASITTCMQKNNEFYVAEEAAHAIGSDHYYIPRPADLYEGRLDTAVRLCSGMHSFVECQFLGYGSLLPASFDTLMTGLALDVFLGGLYLPKDPVRWFGRQTLHYQLRPIVGDFIHDFIHGVSYRMKTLNPFMLLRNDRRSEMEESLRESLGSIVQRGKELGATGYDLWEYMHYHNFSRHYSFPMMTSIRTWADCRSPGLENDVFDLAISMSAEQKVNATPYIRAVSRLNTRLMKIRNANTNLPAWMPLPAQSWVKAILMIGNRLFGTKYPQSPGWQDRSWPKVSVSLSASEEISRVIHGLANSPDLEALDIFDMAVIRRIVNEHEMGLADHGAALAVLLTLVRFIGMVSAGSQLYVPFQNREELF